MGDNLHESLKNVVACCTPLIEQTKADRLLNGKVPFDKTAFAELIRELGNLLEHLGSVELV